MQESGADTDLQRKDIKKFHSHSSLIKEIYKEFFQDQNSTKILDSILIKN